MKISKKMISFPPYLSTSWKNVRELHCDNGQLIITLEDDSSVAIPGLDDDTIERVFEAHAAYLEESEAEELPRQDSPVRQQKGSFQLPFQMISNKGEFEQMSQVLQHNPEQADAPDLPEEMLNKIGSVAEILAPNDPDMIPEPEPHCNCFHCQITRAVQKGIQRKTLEEEPVKEVEAVEEEVSDDDLKFRSWDIEQSGDEIYRVSNPLDSEEQYFVHLKDPIGCTCGKSNCEHIEAVLKS